MFTCRFPFSGRGSLNPLQNKSSGVIFSSAVDPATSLTGKVLLVDLHELLYEHTRGEESKFCPLFFFIFSVLHGAIDHNSSVAISPLNAVHESRSTPTTKPVTTFQFRRIASLHLSIDRRLECFSQRQQNSSKGRKSKDIY
jgi:hypothetical protein